jgi:peptidoglycan/LPS O-acetylase OafA/YrhL
VSNLGRNQITPRNSNYRRDIQVLRGLAVLAVVFFHAYEDYFPLGYLGVDVFFVLSGFVVTPLILQAFTDQTGGLKAFYSRRFYRLAPAMLFMLFCTSIFILLFGSPSSFKIFGQQVLYSLLILGNYGAFSINGDYFTNSGSPLIHTWSLSVEEQIYLFLPFMIFLVLKLKKHRNVTKTIIVIFFTVTCISLSAFSFPLITDQFSENIGISDPNTFSFYSPSHRIWQFTLGGIGYFLTRKQIFKPKQSRRNQILNLFLIVLLFASVPLDSRGGSVIASFLTLVIICFRSLDSFPEKLMQPLEWLGDRSYSIYLFHMPITYIAYFSPYFANSSLGAFGGLLALFLSISFGSISYSKVENRYRINKESTNSSLAARLPLLAFLAFSLLVSSLMIRGASNDYWGIQKKPSQPAVGWELDSNCNRMSGENDPPCVYKSSKAVKTVLLVGDSFAGQLSQALVDASKESNWNSVIWTMPSCNFIIGNETEDVSKSCLIRNNSVLKWIHNNKPDAIIVSQYNRSYLPQDKLKTSILILKNLVPTVLVVGNTPVFPDKLFMASPAIFQSTYSAPKRISISLMNNSDQIASDALLAKLRDLGIPTVDLNFLWCDYSHCNRFGRDGWFFYDPAHLSVAGAQLSVSFFASFLRNQ